MSFLFGKKQSVMSMAEVLEEGAPKMLEWSRIQMQNASKSFRKHEEYMQTPMFQIAVHVTPQGGSPFDAQMETSLTVVSEMRKGIQVQVKYDPNHKEQVTLVDDIYALQARNPQLVEKKPGATNKPATLCIHCGKYYEGTPRFCPNCGQPVSPA